MKKKELKTSKGEILLIDLPGAGNTNTLCKLSDLGYQIICALTLITEKQASEIVDVSFNTPRMYKDYINNMPGFTATESLHSLLRSKEIYLYENPYKNQFSIQSLEGSQIHSKNVEEAEEKTFFNPYLFKRV